jgi:hypothetical protein
MPFPLKLEINRFILPYLPEGAQNASSAVLTPSELQLSDVDTKTDGYQNPIYERAGGRYEQWARLLSPVTVTFFKRHYAVVPVGAPVKIYWNPDNTKGIIIDAHLYGGIHPANNPQEGGKRRRTHRRRTHRRRTHRRSTRRHRRRHH